MWTEFHWAMWWEKMTWHQLMADLIPASWRKPFVVLHWMQQSSMLTVHQALLFFTTGYPSEDWIKDKINIRMGADRWRPWGITLLAKGMPRGASQKQIDLKHPCIIGMKGQASFEHNHPRQWFFHAHNITEYYAVLHLPLSYKWRTSELSPYSLVKLGTLESKDC